MKIILITLFTFCFAFAEAQTPSIKIKRKGEKECDCHAVISKEFVKRATDKKKKFTKGTAYLKGKVVDATTQKPVVNTAVEFIFGKGLVAASCTDSTGEFMLINIPVCKGKLLAKKCGFKNMEVSGIELVHGKTIYQDMGLTPIIEKKKKK